MTRCKTRQTHGSPRASPGRVRAARAASWHRWQRFARCADVADVADPRSARPEQEAETTPRGARLAKLQRRVSTACLAARLISPTRRPFGEFDCSESARHALLAASSPSRPPGEFNVVETLATVIISPAVAEFVGRTHLYKMVFRLCYTCGAPRTNVYVQRGCPDDCGALGRHYERCLYALCGRDAAGCCGAAHASRLRRAGVAAGATRAAARGDHATRFAAARVRAYGHA